MNIEKIVYEVNDFNELKWECWAGAVQTLEQAQEKGLENEVIELCNSLISSAENGFLSMTQLNEYIWFDDGLEYDLKEYYNVDLYED